MVVKLPKNDYEREILTILKTRDDFTEMVLGVDKSTKKKTMIPVWSDGEKSIIYDLCTQNIPKYIKLDWENLDINDYVNKITDTYMEHKNMVLLSLISCCINNLEMGYKTKPEAGEIIFLN